MIAPDLRGFGGSDRPADPAGYTMPTLIADVLGMLEARGVERTAVIGHDWGAALAWSLGSAAPQVVDRLAVLSVGHPAGFFTDSGQPAGTVLVHAVLPVRWGGRGGAAARRLGAVADSCCGPHGDLDRYLATWTVPAR